MFLYGVTQAQEQQFPAAYSNITQPVVGEHAFTPGDMPNFDPSARIAKSERSILFRPNEATLLYDNGSVFNVTEPDLLSVLQSGSLNMNTYGANADLSSGYTMGDSFTLDNPAEITSMEFYSYQTGASAPPSIIGVYVQVFDGDPSAGGTVIWGDMSTERYYESMMTDGFRVLETDQGNRDRKVELVVAETPGLSLEAGTYFIEMGFMGMESSGPWAPPVTITGQATTGAGLQNTPEGWIAWVDSGTNTGQGLPFQVYGTETLGVNDHIQTGLSYFPNPMKDVLNITSNLKVESVRAFNMLGQQVIKNAQLRNGQMDVSFLAAGAYLVEVTFEGGVKETFKVLK